MSRLYDYEVDYSPLSALLRGWRFRSASAIRDRGCRAAGRLNPTRRSSILKGNQKMSAARTQGEPAVRILTVSYFPEPALSSQFLTRGGTLLYRPHTSSREPTLRRGLVLHINAEQGPA